MKYPVLITCAVPEELASFAGRLRDRKYVVIAKRRLIKGQLKDSGKSIEIYLLFTGMGGEIAAKALAAVLQEIHPERIIISGTAGGLKESIATGDLFIARNHGGEEFQSEVFDVLKLADIPGQVWREDLTTVESVTSGAAAKTVLHQSSGADAVDMESAFLAKIAEERGIPFIVFRVISDGLYDEMPLPFGHFLKEDGFLSLPKLILHLLTRPWKIPALIAFASKVRRACEKLGLALEKLLLSGA